jgi:ATP-binding cassette subfamily B protein
LSTIINADYILYLENGEISESGNHHELLEKDGKYKKLFESQFVEL